MIKNPILLTLLSLGIFHQPLSIQAKKKGGKYQDEDNIQEYHWNKEKYDKEDHSSPLDIFTHQIEEQYEVKRQAAQGQLIEKFEDYSDQLKSYKTQSQQYSELLVNNNQTLPVCDSFCSKQCFLRLSLSDSQFIYDNCLAPLCNCYLPNLEVNSTDDPSLQLYNNILSLKSKNYKKDRAQKYYKYRDEDYSMIEQCSLTCADDCFSLENKVTYEIMDQCLDYKCQCQFNKYGDELTQMGCNQTCASDCVNPLSSIQEVMQCVNGCGCNKTMELQYHLQKQQEQEAKLQTQLGVTQTQQEPAFQETVQQVPQVTSEAQVQTQAEKKPSFFRRVVNEADRMVTQSESSQNLQSAEPQTAEIQQNEESVQNNIQEVIEGVNGNKVVIEVEEIVQRPANEKPHKRRQQIEVASSEPEIENAEEEEQEDEMVYVKRIKIQELGEDGTGKVTILEDSNFTESELSQVVKVFNAMKDGQLSLQTLPATLQPAPIEVQAQQAAEQQALEEELRRQAELEQERIEERQKQLAKIEKKLKKLEFQKVKKDKPLYQFNDQCNQTCAKDCITQSPQDSLLNIYSQCVILRCNCTVQQQIIPQAPPQLMGPDGKKIKPQPIRIPIERNQNNNANYSLEQDCDIQCSYDCMGFKSFLPAQLINDCVELKCQCFFPTPIEEEKAVLQDNPLGCNRECAYKNCLIQGTGEQLLQACLFNCGCNLQLQNQNTQTNPLESATTLFQTKQNSYRSCQPNFCTQFQDLYSHHLRHKLQEEEKRIAQFSSQRNCSMRCIDNCFAQEQNLIGNESESFLVECFQKQCLCSQEYFKSNSKFLPQAETTAVFTPPIASKNERMMLKQNKEEEEYSAKAVFEIEFTILPNNLCCLDFQFEIESNLDEYNGTLVNHCSQECQNECSQLNVQDTFIQQCLISKCLCSDQEIPNLFCDYQCREQCLANSTEDQENCKTQCNCLDLQSAQVALFSDQYFANKIHQKWSQKLIYHYIFALLVILFVTVLYFLTQSLIKGSQTKSHAYNYESQDQQQELLDNHYTKLE